MQELKMDQVETNQTAETFKAIAKETFSIENIDARTDLTLEQIVTYARGEQIAKMVQNETLQTFIHDIKVKLLSKGRKSRQEHTDITKSINAGLNPTATPEQPLKERLFGK